MKSVRTKNEKLNKQGKKYKLNGTEDDLEVKYKYRWEMPMQDMDYLKWENMTGSSTDMVNHPPHYASSKIECIDAMEAMTGQNRDYKTFLTGHMMYLWQVIFKYIWRFPYKENPVEELKKAKFYLERLINRLENTK